MCLKIDARKGFTLIELIIAVLFFVILTGAAVGIFTAVLKTWASGTDAAEIRRNGGMAIEKMVRDLSQASRITIADFTNAISFKADVNHDGNDQTITFDTTNGTDLVRTIDDQPITISPDVQTFTLAYRDSDNSPMSIPSDVASQENRDRIRIIVISLAMSRGDETLFLSSSVYVRNQP